MLREMLRAEVERRWAVLILLACLCAAIPALYAVRLRGVRAEWFALTYVETALLGRVLFWLLVVGCAVWGFDTWSPERRGGWVYALALPVHRKRLFSLRYAAGLVCLCAAMCALLAAAYAAAAVVALPAGMYAYPVQFSLWTALAGWTLYTLGFVVGARSSRPTATVIMLLVALAAGLAVSGRRNERLPGDPQWQFRPSSVPGLLAEPPRLFDY
jgi:hypothetical protein